MSPAQPVPRAAPDLAYEQRVALYGLAAAAKLPPEAVVRLVGHVQPPPVRIELAQPILADAAEVVAHLIVRRVQLRHEPLIAEALIIRPLARFGIGNGKLQPVEPVRVPALSLLFQHVAEGEKLRAAVVEHPVEYNAHAARVALLNELAEIGVGAQTGVYVQVVYGVVFVILPGGEDGVEVDAVGPEPGYVVEVFTYTAYGPAEAGAGERAADALFRTAAGDAPAGAGEAVREDVIYDGVQRPFRDAGDVPRGG